MRMTRFEKARLIGARALQISMGAPSLIEADSTDPKVIAKKELEEDVIPIAIRRPEPGDTS